MPASLRLADLQFKPAIESACFQPLTRAADGHCLQTEIDPNRFLGCFAGLTLSLHGEAQPPVSERILGEAALTPFHIHQSFGFEHPEGLPTKPQRTAFAFETGRLERQPPQGAARSSTDVPA